VGGETRVSDDLVQRAGHAARGLAPGYFALVMARGIISLGLDLRGFAGAPARHGLRTVVVGPSEPPPELRD